MSEWKLFGETPPETPETLVTRGWMNLEGQPGFRQRAAMVTGLAHMVITLHPVASVTDLGCGDGAMLARVAALGVPAWGYDIGEADLSCGWSRGLDVRRGDILRDSLEHGDLLIASEVLEHIADPEGFLRGLPPRVLICSSPSAETGEWHNAIHAWAWDLDGYADLLSRSGWTVAYQAECDGGPNTFAGVTGPQRFQAITAVKS